MATIPTTTQTKDATGLISGIGVTVNESVQAVNKNEPIFAVGDKDLRGYVALSMYQQHSASVIEGGDLGDLGDFELFKGESYASGKPYVMSEATWADATYPY